MLPVVSIASSALGYVRKNRWTWYVGAGLACVIAGAWLFSAKGQEIKSMWKRTETVRSEKSETVLANANIVIVATGGKTEIELDENGVPKRIVNEGGELRVQAVIDLTRSSSGMIARTEESVSSYEFSGDAEGWGWGGRAGAEFGREGTSVGLGLERRLFGSLGIEGSVNVPIADEDRLKRTRCGVALRARW